MRRSEATYIQLPVTTYGTPPVSKDNHGSFFETARARQARRTLSFTVLGTFIAIFLVLSLGSLPSRLPFQPTTNAVEPQGKGESRAGNRRQTWPRCSSLEADDFPDFSKYSRLHTISANELRLDDDGRRLVIVGDVHGMNHQLQ